MKRIITLIFITLLSACANKQVQKPPKQIEAPQQTVTKTTFRQGSHYRLINANAPKHQVNKKIKITEYFLYGCPHCYELEPKLAKWLENNDNIEFNRVPAILGPTWGEMAKFYYVADKLNILEEMHKAFFKEVHASSKQYLSELAIREFFLKNGVTYEEYTAAYYSEEVRNNVNEARYQSVQLRLRGVPAVTINDKWMTAPFYVKNQEQMLEVLDYLVKLESGGGQEK